jgi:hypothetical protein
LRNVVERLIILSKDKIAKTDIDTYVNTSNTERSKLHELFDQFESPEKLQRYIMKEYDNYKGVLA